MLLLNLIDLLILHLNNIKGLHPNGLRKLIKRIQNWKADDEFLINIERNKITQTLCPHSFCLVDGKRISIWNSHFSMGANNQLTAWQCSGTGLKANPFHSAIDYSPSKSPICTNFLVAEFAINCHKLTIFEEVE